MSKPNALRLAAELEACPTISYKTHAAELRRLYADNFSLIVVNKAFAERQKWWNERMFALETQRNQLLEALKALDALFSPCVRDSTQADWIDRARAAIAKAEGQ